MSDEPDPARQPSEADPISQGEGAPDAPAPPMPPPTPPMPPPTPPMPPGATAPQVVYNVTQAAPSNGMAVAALVLGIVGSVLSLTIWGGIILGVLAIVFGALGRSKANEGAPNRGVATAGFVLGIVAVIASLLFVALLISVANDAEGLFGDVRDQVELCLQDPSDPAC